MNQVNWHRFPLQFLSFHDNNLPAASSLLFPCPFPCTREKDALCTTTADPAQPCRLSWNQQEDECPSTTEANSLFNIHFSTDPQQPQVLSEQPAGWDCCRPGLLLGLAHVSPPAVQQVPVPAGPSQGCAWVCEYVIWVSTGTAWMDIWPGSQNLPFLLSSGNHPFLQAMEALDSLWKTHLCKFAGQNSNDAPFYSCESSLLFPAFHKGQNNCYLGQNLIPVLQQWTITTWRWCGLVFSLARWTENSDFSWGFSKEKSDFVKNLIEYDYLFLILLLHSVMTKYMKLNHISSHITAIKSRLQIIYDSPQCNIIYNTILVIPEKMEFRSLWDFPNLCVTAIGLFFIQPCFYEADTEQYKVNYGRKQDLRVCVNWVQ